MTEYPVTITCTVYGRIAEVPTVSTSLSSCRTLRSISAGVAMRTEPSRSVVGRSEQHTVPRGGHSELSVTV
jgi:hypothetical protein